MSVDKSYDVIIVGAGAAGLMAARELTLAGKTVLILEARKRCGGRILTINDDNFPIPIELGAEFVHGRLPITESLIKQAGTKWHKVEGSFWQHRHGKLFQSEEQIFSSDKVMDALEEVKEDIPISQFLETFFSDDEEIREGLKSYVEGYYAGDINRVSTLALKEELEEGDDDYRIEGGYKTIIDSLVKEVQTQGCIIALDSRVLAIEWKANEVVVATTNQTFRSEKVIITAPLEVLKKNAIAFYPVLPQLQEALDSLDLGPAIKILLSFKTAFWEERSELKDLSMLFSDEVIPTWWTQFPKQVPVLVGWAAGGQAKDLAPLENKDLFEKALQSLANIFSVSIEFLKQHLKGWSLHNWNQSPYTSGGYSYDTINGDQVKNTIKPGIDNTLFFAGEGWFHGLELGTVEAALSSGKETAQHIIARSKMKNGS
jgi:monoamine oxidase